MRHALRPGLRQNSIFNPAGDVGATYYVSATGNDSTGDGSQGAPWATLSHAISEASAGDTIRLKKGDSWSIAGDPGVTVDKALTIDAYGTGDDPALTFTDTGTYSTGIHVNADDVTIRNLWISLNGAGEGAIRIGTNGGTLRHRATIDAVEVTNSGCAVMIYGTYAEIKNCYFHDLSMVVATGAGGDYGANGVWAGEGADNFSIHDCIFVNCRAAALDYPYDGGGIEIYGTVETGEIYNCSFNGCQGIIEIGSSGSGHCWDVTMYNCIGWDNHGAIHINSIGGTWATDVQRLKIHHCTFVGTASDTCVEITDNDVTGTQLQMYNCAIVDFGWYGYKMDTDTVVDGWNHDYNLLRVDNWDSPNSNDWWGAPGFVDAGNNDYHLAAGSGLIDQGTDLGYATDYDGVAWGTPPSVGAYEYVA